MNWKLILIDILFVIGTSGIFTWIIQEIWKHQFKKKILKYEYDLKRTIDHLNYKASKLYDKRICIIEQLYEKLVKLDLAMIEMTSLLKYMSTNVDENEKIENEKIKTASDCHNDFYIFYLKNKIFLSQETCDLIDSLKDKYFDSYFDYTYGKKYENSDSELTYKLAKAASDKVRKEIPIVLKNIEQDFRTTIGIENEKK